MAVIVPGWNHVHFESLDSTNEYVLRNVEVLPDRSVVTADTQTAGKGRLGRSWASPPGGLYASLLLKPAPRVGDARAAGLLVADLVCEILEKQGVKPVVKWPNDVLIGDRKLAGVLAESHFPAVHGESWLILGFGVNLSVVPDTGAAGRGLEPTALSRHGRGVPLPLELLEWILSRMNETWPDRTTNPLSGRIAGINSRLWRRGNLVRVSAGDGRVVYGSVLGLDESGRLKLASASGVRYLEVGELRPL